MPLNKAKGRMFHSVGWTWNPICGCDHGCPYCYARRLRKGWGLSFEPELREHYFKDKMPDDGSWIFVGSMGDVFCWGVPDKWILKLLEYIKNCEANNKFLLQTKNPNRFIDYDFFTQYLTEVKDRVIVGTTLESTRDFPWGSANSMDTRVFSMEYMKREGYKTFLSLEPLADFDPVVMKAWIFRIQPEAVEIGLENYTSFLDRPSDEKVVGLLRWLKYVEIPYVLKENLRHLEETAND